MKTYISAKIMHLKVTGRHLDYHGSQTIPVEFLTAAGIEPYEQVHVVNMRNGNRWVTYAIQGEPGVCTLNGAAALLGEVGDKLIIMSYTNAERFAGAKVLFAGLYNQILPDQTVVYSHASQPAHP